MTNALIGSTGFVGTNLLAAHDFFARFHSRNIADIHGQSFDVVVCAAAPATMWAANKDPEGDKRNILGLVTHLEQLKAERFVLISTIATLAEASGLDETTTRFETAKAYGHNRRLLEEAVTARFPNTFILRLPALFGKGLKKNFLYDILNPVPSFLTSTKYDELASLLPEPAAAVLKSVYDFSEDLGMYRCARDKLLGEARVKLTTALQACGFTALNFTNADSTYQFYDLARLWSDIGVVMANEVPLAHLAPEPLRAADIFQGLTGETFEARTAPLYREDMRTQHAGLWGQSGTYIQDGASVLHSLKAFYSEAITQ